MTNFDVKTSAPNMTDPDREEQRTKVPEVSICVPIYNGAEFLDACLATIRAQSYGDYEVLIVDDCSTDAGPEIARRWEESDSRFVLHVNASNRGLVGNWNRCIELARGQWIKFLFQDDLMAPDCLSKMIAAGQHGGGFVACARELLFEEGIDQVAKDWYAKHASTIASIYRGEPHHDASRFVQAKVELLGFNTVGEPSVTMIRRALFDEYGLFDPLLVHICDGEMWNRIGSNVGVDYVSEPLVAFRVHAGAASANFRERPFRGAALDVMVERYKILHGAEYANFRTIARRLGQEQRLRRSLLSAINYAFDLARELRKTRPDDRRNDDELVFVANRTMGYRSAWLRHTLFRIRRTVGWVRADERLAF